jgi:hypothetical protein
MAAEDTFASHPASSENSILSNGLIGILRARGIEATETLTKNFSYNPMIKGESLLIGANQTKNNMFPHVFIVHLLPYLSTESLILWYNELPEKEKYTK